MRLTELGEGTEDTRRRAALTELVRQAEEAAQLRGVLNTLADARLITLNEDSAEVAHEALIREWQRLHEWLTQDREGLRVHRHLTDAAREWAVLGGDAGALYRGARLAQAQEWAAANEGRLNDAERTFLAASLQQEQHEVLEREAQRARELEAAQKLAAEQAQRAEEQAGVRPSSCAAVRSCSPLRCCWPCCWQAWPSSLAVRRQSTPAPPKRSARWRWRAKKRPLPSAAWLPILSAASCWPCRR